VRRRDGGVPDRLATFVPSDWPGGDDEERFAAWVAARVAYADRHGWPGGRAEADGIGALRQRPDEPWNPYA
jgi:hypothetical protein